MSRLAESLVDAVLSTPGITGADPGEDPPSPVYQATVEAVDAVLAHPFQTPLAQLAERVQNDPASSKDARELAMIATKLAAMACGPEEDRRLRLARRLTELIESGKATR